MTPMVRTAFVSALSLAALDAFAKADARVNDKCILMLEARPVAPPDAPAPRVPCPVAVGYGASGSTRVPATPALRSRHAVPGAVRDASAGPAGGRLDPSRPALNV